MYQMATVIPGLALRRGFREVVHVQSGRVVLTFCEGMSRERASGLMREQRKYRVVEDAPLRVLSRLNWEGELGEAHEALLSKFDFSTQAGTEAAEDRVRRIMAGYRQLVKVMREHRAVIEPLLLAVRAADNAQVQAQSSGRPSDKAKATRLHKAVEAECAAARVSLKAARRLADLNTPTLVLQLSWAIERQQTVLWNLDRARSSHLSNARKVMQIAFLWRTRRNAAPNRIADLKVCLMMTGQGTDLWRLAGMRPRHNGEAGEAYLVTANRLRLSSAAPSLNAASAEVRARTRDARIEAGRKLLNNQYVTPPLYRELRKLASEFYMVARFKGSEVRRRRFAPLLEQLRTLFPDPAKYCAALRFIRNFVAESKWGSAPIQDILADLPDAPRWTPRELPQTPVSPAPRWIQPSLF